MKRVLMLAFVAILAGCGSGAVRDARIRDARLGEARNAASPGAPAEVDPLLARDYVHLPIEEPLGVNWPPQMVTLQARFEKPCRVESLDLRDSWGRAVPFQVVQPQFQKDYLTSCDIALITGLSAGETRSFRLYYDDQERPAPRRKGMPNSPLLTSESLLEMVLSTGRISLRVPAGSGSPKKPLPAGTAPAPIQAVMGADNLWRGLGELCSPFDVEKWETQVQAVGPVYAQVWVKYWLTGKHFYELTMQAVAGADWITVEEHFDVGANSCLILRSVNCESARVAARRRPQTQGFLITRLPAHAQPASIAGRPAKRFESVAAGDGDDLWALFSARIGRWQNPVGSEINYIRLNESLAFHFPLNKGSRCWGIHASVIDEGTSSLCRSMAQAADASLDAVLRMDILPPAAPLEILKEEPRVPEEVARVVDDLAPATTAVVDQGFSGPAVRVMDFDRVARAAHAWAGLRQTAPPGLHQARLAEVRLAFLGCVLDDPSFFNYDLLLAEGAPFGANFDAGSIDWLWNLGRIYALGEIASALRGNPNAAGWLAHVRSQAGLSLKYLVSPEGAWLGGGKPEQARELLQRIADTLNTHGSTDLRDDPNFKAIMSAPVPQ